MIGTRGEEFGVRAFPEKQRPAHIRRKKKKKEGVREAMYESFYLSVRVKIYDRFPFCFHLSLPTSFFDFSFSLHYLTKLVFPPEQPLTYDTD